jgi:hypothetical protein
MLGKFIARYFIAIADEMRRFPASNENTDQCGRKAYGRIREKVIFFLYFVIN